MNIVEFLLARIEEDRKASTTDKERRRCDAMRHIVWMNPLKQRFTYESTYALADTPLRAEYYDVDEIPLPLLALAGIYSDHPDHRHVWQLRNERR